MPRTTCALRALSDGDQDGAEFGCLAAICCCEIEDQLLSEEDDEIAEALSRFRHPAGKGTEWR